MSPSVASQVLPMQHTTVEEMEKSRLGQTFLKKEQKKRMGKYANEYHPDIHASKDAMLNTVR